MITELAFRNSVLVSLEFHCPGNSRKASMDDIEVDADKDALRLSKELLRSPELQQVRRTYTIFKRFLDARRVPGNYFRAGCYLLARTHLIDVYREYSAAKERLAAAVEAFLAAYPGRIQEAEERLRSQFDPADYPTDEEFRSAVYLKLGVITASTPTDIPEEVQADQREAAEAEWRSTVEEVRTALREGLRAVLARATDRLRTNENGRRPGLTEKGYDRIMEFLSLFEGRDVTNDAATRELVRQAQQVLGEVDLRATKGAQGELLLGQLQNIQTALDGMIVSARPARRMHLEDDNEPPQRDTQISDQEPASL